MAGMEWAGTTWRFIHEYSFYVDMHEHASADAQAAFHSILRELPRLLPCEECRGHLEAHLALHPLPAPQCSASCEFPNARYCADLHNAVNVRQGKPVLPFDQVHAMYVGSVPPACPAGPIADMEWAGTTWGFIHQYSFYVDMHEHASADAQAAFHSILRALPRLLPCEECRGHFAAHLALHPLPAPQCSATCEFPNARFCVDLRNAVHAPPGKPGLPFDLVHAIYVGAAPPACPAITAGPMTALDARRGTRSGTWSQPRQREAKQTILLAVALGVAVLVVLMAVLQVAWIATHRGN
jgi:hypothetical protein